MPRSTRALALAALLGTAPLAAQTHPLFADGPAFGGSLVFSLGANPMANPAAVAPLGASLWAGFVDGDARPKDNADQLERLASGDPWKMSGALTQLKDGPWALRGRAYGLAMTENGKTLAYTREEWNGLWVRPDLDPSHRGSLELLALNTTTVEARRAQVDRLVIGGTVPQGEWKNGVNLRIERWKFGRRIAALNPGGEPGAGPVPFTDPKAMLDFKEAPETVTTATLDAGTTWEMTRGIRLGTMIQRLVPRKFGDVEEKPQLRVGLQIELGSMISVAIEADANAAQRMPLPVDQKSQALSLAIHPNPHLSILLGGERRLMGEAARASAGITALLRMGETQIGVGFQYADDRPVKGLGWRMGR